LRVIFVLGTFHLLGEAPFRKDDAQADAIPFTKGCAFYTNCNQCVALAGLVAVMLTSPRNSGDWLK
jgi:hypothetical protein